MDAGLLLWNQTRQQWLGNKRSQSRPQVRDPRIGWITWIDNLILKYSVICCHASMFIKATKKKTHNFLVSLAKRKKPPKCQVLCCFTSLIGAYFLSLIQPLCFCSWNATYDSLLTTNKPFPQPIPLPVSCNRQRLFPLLLLLIHTSTTFLTISWILNDRRW